MTPEEINELKELVEFLKENGIAEFQLDRGDLKVSLKFEQPAGFAAAAAQPDLASLARALSVSPNAAVAAVHPVVPPATAQPAEEAGLHILKSPIVGTFYESPSPGTPAFLSVGDRVEKGQTVCIVEAMKLMNEIESDASGEIVKRLVSNGQPVEYGQPLFAIRPR